jgi:hypothetical protein
MSLPLAFSLAWPTRWALCIFLVGLVIGCRKSEEVVSPYVQDIIPLEQEHGPIRWYLSPLGDKLVYDISSDSNTAFSDQAIVRFLVNGRDFKVANCATFSWLDNENIYCYYLYDDGYEPFVVTIDAASNAGEFPKISVKKTTAGSVKLDTLLKQATTIYRLQSLTEPDSLLVLDTDPQKKLNQYYHITGLENLDVVLKNYNYTTIPLYGRDGEPFKKIYSPNGKYYYLLRDSLGIYDETDNQLLAEFKPHSDYESFFQIGGFFPNKSEGWAADSSGVYFQVRHSSGFGPPAPIEPIQKLCVPGISGCPSAN